MALSNSSQLKFKELDEQRVAQGIRKCMFKFFKLFTLPKGNIIVTKYDKKLQQFEKCEPN